MNDCRFGHLGAGLGDLTVPRVLPSNGSGLDQRSRPDVQNRTVTSPQAPVRAPTSLDVVLEQVFTTWDYKRDLHT